ncbi:MAG: ACT domain-containing protein [Bacillota bacterium]
MIIKQLSIFVENKSGRLAQIAETLAENDIDIRALSIADTTNFGILRLIVNKPNLAEQVLQESGMTVSLTEVIAIEISDKPGGLEVALKALNYGGIGIEYMYAFIGRPHKSAHVIIRVEDNDAAIKVLSENGIGLLKSRDLYED